MPEIISYQGGGELKEYKILADVSISTCCFTSTRRMYAQLHMEWMIFDLRKHHYVDNESSLLKLGQAGAAKTPVSKNSRLLVN